MKNFFKKLFSVFAAKRAVRNTTSWVFKHKPTQKVSLPPPPKPQIGLYWCPFAYKDFPRGRSQGAYKELYPKGAVVHFTAGHPHQKLTDAIELQRNNKHLYFVIAHDGSIAQNFPLTHWGYHSGSDSRWGGIKERADKHLVGIEVCCPGKLSAGGVPWFKNEPYEPALIRKVGNEENREAGTYYRYTKSQEQSLIKLLRWLKSNNPDVFDYDLVCGHDEASPKRKNDPGGSLSLTMPQLRDHLKNA